jgi:hypothetical protein
MKLHLIAALALASGSLLLAQEGEKKVPKDSARVTLQGCAKGRTFIVGPKSEHGAANVDIAPGRRFRLNGDKKILAEIKSGEDRMVEVTGLIRKADLHPPQGVSLAGGRVRIGGVDPREPVGTVSTSPSYNEATFDLESTKPLPERCPAQ